MQTGIHFENGQVYTWIMDENRTIEKEPTVLHGLWTDYMTELTVSPAGRKGSYGIVMDGLNHSKIEEAKELSERLGIVEGLRLYTKEEAALGLVQYQQNDLDKGKTAIFDYRKNHMDYYEVKKQSDTIVVEKQDFTDIMSQAMSNSQKDQFFLKVIGKALAKGVTTTVYLCGEGFEGNWFTKSSRTLCIGRRVFMGKHLFACGAAYMAGKDAKEEQDGAFILTETMTICQIGLTLCHHGKDVFCPILPAGKPWFEAKGKIQMMVSGINKLVFELRDKNGIKQASVFMTLNGINKDSDQVYKLEIQGEYLSPDQCKMKVTDQGFGSLRPSSHQIWQQVIHLERGDFRE